MTLDPLTMTPDQLRAMAAEREMRLRGAAAVTKLTGPTEAQLAAANEKAVELACDKLAQAMGFEVIKFSHPGRTKQTPGIPDRRYRHRARGVAFWLECKAAQGVQSPAQREFQLGEEACGSAYVLGGRAALAAHLKAHGFPVPDEYLPTPADGGEG